MICCDFCGISEHQASRLAAASRPCEGGDVAICHACARIAVRELDEAEKKEAEETAE